MCGCRVFALVFMFMFFKAIGTIIERGRVVLLYTLHPQLLIEGGTPKNRKKDVQPFMIEIVTGLDLISKDE